MPPKSATLEDLNDGRFSTEPKKDFSIGSRHLVAHLLYNVLQEKKPRTEAGKIPSIDENALSNMKNPIAEEILKHKKMDRALSSINGALTHVYPSFLFGENQKIAEKKALIFYNVMGFNCVERIFTQSGESIPINVDKRVRKAFKTPLDTISMKQLISNTGTEWIKFIPISEWRIFLEKVNRNQDIISFDWLCSLDDSIKEQIQIPKQIWLGFDYKQAELYILALFSKDSNLRDALDGDFHSYVASKLFDISLNSVTKEQRNIAKTFSFALIYSSFDLRSTTAIIMKEKLGFTEDQIKEYLTKYCEEFHILFSWVSDAILDWFDNDGLVRYFRGAVKKIDLQPYYKRDLDKLKTTKEARVAINTYGQNSIGLLMKHNYSKMFECGIHEKTSEHIQVFDSMLFLANINEICQIFEIVNKIVSANLCKDDFKIQMRPEWKSSSMSWFNMEDLNLDAPDNLNLPYSSYSW